MNKASQRHFLLHIFWLTSDISLHGAWLRKGVGKSSRLSRVDEKGENTSKNISHNYLKSLIVVNHKTRLWDNHFSSSNTELVFFVFCLFCLYISRKLGGTMDLDWGKRRSETKENCASHVWDKGSHSHLMNEGRERKEDRSWFLFHPGKNIVRRWFNFHIWLWDSSYLNIKCNSVNIVPTMCQWLCLRTQQEARGLLLSSWSLMFVSMGKKYIWSTTYSFIHF